MKPYTVSIDIELPRARVVELFDDTENVYMWQDGLQSFALRSGEAGQPGAVSDLVFQVGKRRIEMTETVTERDLPYEFNGFYEWPGGRNTLVNHFIELTPDCTRWESTCTYEFANPMLKVMGALFPGMFKKQNMKFLKNFKAFAETGRDVREGSAHA